MIRRLRWKFAAILMTIISIFLIIILATMYYTNKIGYEQRCRGMLQIVLQDLRDPSGFRPHSDGELPPPQREEQAASGNQPVPEEAFSEDGSELSHTQEHFAVLAAEQTPDGQIRVLLNQIYHIDEETAVALVKQADSLGQRDGVLQAESLRYLRSADTPDGTVHYVFADIYMEQYALHRQLIHSFAIGLLALAAFFGVSVWLSRWSTRPIAEAWQIQQQFVSDASHELKTPLTVILSNVSLLKQSTAISDSSDRRRIEHIDSEAARMKQLTESLLVLARSDCSAGAPSASFVLLDFSYLTDSCVSTFEPVAFEMGKSISGDIERDLVVNGDENRLHQLVSILMDNGCKYSSAGSCIRVILKQEVSEAVLSVTTDGAPLRPEELKQLFHRFYRADPSRGNVAGFGLGLSIARHICTEHKGKITATTDGVGTNTFTVRLPLSRRDGDR